jgi:hypothetical protein
MTKGVANDMSVKWRTQTPHSEAMVFSFVVVVVIFVRNRSKYVASSDLSLINFT